jgi:hypothetical protein
MSAVPNEDPVTGITVQVVANSTGDPINNADIMGKKRGTTAMMKSVKRTGPDGYAVITTLDPGEYEYEILCDTYEPEPGFFTITEGVMAELRVRMRRS